ncbi:cytochrome c biogenesis CcdA family protein [Mycobacterium nebraskense]|uniref:cytochrome c biogenesis CcdA family protein n=1 Tax=Mycobacterium nebraskense TaxID=244292 RepID=UPI000617EDE1|nr:cytochrome c biogenesis protein CcdA [Mycobacterium nebraskense]KKC05007.1 mercury transporter [Mycobacterium nebraskense]
MSLLALAFTAGMLAPVNPCGFALLPAWITSTIATGGTDAVLVRLARALRTGTVLTITGTLTLAGMAISAGARPLVTAAPWLGITILLTLAMLGVFMLTGRTIGLRMPARMRHRPNSPAAGDVLAAGIGYALASLSCTFGVLLAVIAQAQATSGWGGLLAVFTAYTAGAATILMLVSIGTAMAGTALTRHLGILARHGTRVTALVLIATGAYLAWYWLPAATGHTASGTNLLTAWSATATGWLQDHALPVSVIAAFAVMATAVAVYWTTHRRPVTGKERHRR